MSKHTKKSERSSRTNLLLLGGTLGALTTYLTYEMFAAEKDSSDLPNQNANMLYDFFIPTMTSALIGLPTMLALAFQNQATPVPVSLVVAAGTLGMLQPVEGKNWFKEAKNGIKRFGHSLDDKFQQNNRHLEAKIKQCYEHQKKYDSPQTWFNALSDKVDRMIPNEAKPFLSGSSISVTTNGQQTSISGSYRGSNELNLYSYNHDKTQDKAAASSIEPSPSGVNFGDDEVDTESPDLEKTIITHRKEMLRSEADKANSSTKKMFNSLTRSMGKAADFDERRNDPRFEHTSQSAKNVCATTGVVAQTLTNTAVGVAVTAASEGNVALGRTAMILTARHCKKLGDTAQDACQYIYAKREERNRHRIRK